MFNIGDRVRTIKATRHSMIGRGEVGIVMEVRRNGTVTDGVSVEFMRKPDPIIAKVFGKDPNTPEPFRCLFPLTSAARQIELA
jgi:hypothetical protein